MENNKGMSLFEKYYQILESNSDLMEGFINYLNEMIDIITDFKNEAEQLFDPDLDEDEIEEICNNCELDIDNLEDINDFINECEGKIDAMEDMILSIKEKEFHFRDWNYDFSDKWGNKDGNLDCYLSLNGDYISVCPTFSRINMSAMFASNPFCIDIEDLIKSEIDDYNYERE